MIGDVPAIRFSVVTARSPPTCSGSQILCIGPSVWYVSLLLSPSTSKGYECAVLNYPWLLSVQFLCRKDYS